MPALAGIYSWIDLDGEGNSGILSEQAGSWLYKHNLGNGHFDEHRQVAEKPSYSTYSASSSILFIVFTFRPVAFSFSFDSK